MHYRYPISPPPPAPPGYSGGFTHPNLVGDRRLAVLTSKAHLVIRMIQLKVGNDLFLQVSTHFDSTLFYNLVWS